MHFKRVQNVNMLNIDDFKIISIEDNSKTGVDIVFTLKCIYKHCGLWKQQEIYRKLVIWLERFC